MKSKDTMVLPIKLQKLLRQKSDAKNPMTMSDIQAYLEQDGIVVDRRTIYKAIHHLNEDATQVHSVKIGRNTGYYYEHTFDPMQAFVIMQTLQNAPAISSAQTRHIIQQLQSIMSETQIASLPKSLPTEAKSNENDVMINLRKLIRAIHEKHYVSFRYFNRNTKREKVYRRQGTYRMVPYGIVCSDGKFYCVFYNENHDSFNNFRLDKMDHLTVLQASEEKPQPFNLKTYIRNSFAMYSGSAKTIRLECQNSIFDQLYERFGKNMIIESQNENTFIASVKTTITPPLISWLILFHDTMKILSPDEVKEQLQSIATSLLQTYGKEG